MTSLWLEGAHVRESQIDGSATKDAPNAEVIVVGAGITGLVSAVLLARAGKRVLVVEARTPGAVTTGNTTAKVSLLQGSRLSTISKRHSLDLVRQYVEGNREGQAWLEQYCKDREIDLQYEDAYSYAQFDHGLPTARAEFEAARSAGLGVNWVDQADVPFEFRGGVRLAEQIQFDPMPFLAALIAELRERGGRLMTGQRVHAASTAGGRVSLKLRDAQGREQVAAADHCILATGTPILDRGGFFARLHPSRSYCVAFEVPGPLPRPMMLSVDQPTRSVRYAPTSAGERLIVGGGGHTVGRKDSARTSYDELVGWTKRHFPGAQPTHYWSAQDYVPVDELPYVGPLLPGSDHFLVATGFAKWGMTNGVAAALLLAKHLLGGEQARWASAFASWSPHELTGLTTALKINMEVGWHLATGWVTPVAHRNGQLREGAGSVSGPPWHMVARSMVDGVERCVSPVCTHLGGVLSWNDAEKSWDCPLHGSRFGSDGAVLEGPATRDLSR
ncbi:FAD-dependent oxidoreductase [Mycobacterium crocinum]|uniref:FAD-dependent oxidoreductase n=1 Tax=Mycolicibacterium crocinum TaxID=388459 RepID=A0ABY3TQT4_9MYCO|nr:FAD-dependent oxidoreductase [Mycolicibacterium crocinum]MCV7215607.1 FAD-dependent oxidoreductase [Mycolicibacterium crocinum]ULN43032.1 FAD-dependent oxidoreductase [Mycolicibacterium crocinum]